MAGVFLALLQAQDHPTIEVGEDRLLSADGPARPLAESHLSADPGNPNHLLIGVIQFDSLDRNNRTCVAWASFDGGLEWERHAFPVLGCFPGASSCRTALQSWSWEAMYLGTIHPKNCFDVYFTASPDGGETFLPEVRVSSATSCPDTPQNKGVFDPGMTFGAGGDCSGLAATLDGAFHVVWSGLIPARAYASFGRQASE